MATQIQLRRDTAANWDLANTVLTDGEVGLVVDGNNNVLAVKIGNGTSAWTALDTHVPILSGVQNALEDSGEGVPVSDVTTFLLKGLSAQTSKVLGVEATDSTDVKFSVDKDGNCEVEGTLDVTGATTLTGGVAGDLNLLTGALQYAGVDAMSIRQIVSATWSGVTHNVTVNWIDKEQTNFQVFGGKITIVPKSASSKIFLIGSFLVRDYESTNNLTNARIGNVGYIVQDTTAAAGAVYGFSGTLLDRQIFCNRQHYTNSPTTDHYDGQYLNVYFDLLDASSTNSRTYDYVLSNYYSEQDYTQCYPTAEKSFFMAIEIG